MSDATQPRPRRVTTAAVLAVLAGFYWLSLGTVFGEVYRGPEFRAERGPASDQATAQEMLQADHTFITAVSDADKRAVAELLDANFSWTDSQGKMENKPELLADLPKAGIANESPAISKHYIYGEIGDVQANLGRMHALREV